MIEESPGLALAELLAADGGREVNVFDPVAIDAAVGRLGQLRPRVCDRPARCSSDPTSS